MTSAFQSFKNKITYRIDKRTGWGAAKSRSIANEIVQRVRNDSGGGILWKVKFQHGEYSASQFSSLNDFITSLEEMSIPADCVPPGVAQVHNEELLKSLFKKFQTAQAIEAVSAYTQQFTEVEMVNLKQRFQSTFSHIKNDAKTLVKQAKANLNQWKNSKKITYANLKTKLAQYRTPAAFVRTFFLLFGAIGALVTDIEVTLGILPLGGMGIESPISVTDIDVAHSNKIVKYRAVGSIYLAHQVGGKDSIKITGKLHGEMRLWFLTALWIMTLVSQGYWEVVDWNSDMVKYVSTGVGSPYSFRDGIGKLTKLSKVDNIITEEPAYEKHITFPVITQHEIIPNAYIETFSFEEKVESGREVITYDLMMRTYVEPKLFLADIGRTKTRVAKQETKTEQMIKFGLNFVYRLIQQGKEQFSSIDSSTWKVENYHELDAVDIATTMMLGMAGVITA